MVYVYMNDNLYHVEKPMATRKVGPAMHSSTKTGHEFIPTRDKV